MSSSPKPCPTDKTISTDVVILGGGAAGLMCAAQLGQAGLKVQVLDHANKVGKKILMSGGGRCNFTNYEILPHHYLSKNPHFCKSALSRYTQWDFLDLVHKYGIAFHEKSQGQLFCDNKAKDILNMLLQECDLSGVEIHTSTDIIRVNGQEGFSVQTSRGKFSSSALVVATGGLSIPTMGATGFGYELAKQFELKVTAKHASLVPFTLATEHLRTTQSLAGVSLTAQMSVDDTCFHDQLLFTHKGLSGPAVLQLSNYWWPGDEVEIDFFPTHSLSELLEDARHKGSNKTIGTILCEHLPKRFVQSWLGQCGTCESGNVKSLLERTPKQAQPHHIKMLEEQLHRFRFIPKGTEGYRTAEVTRGGICTDEVSSKTFEAKKHPGLYFIGEVLDVTGWLGGYNFQWAWASGWCAAQAIRQRF